MKKTKQRWKRLDFSQKIVIAILVFAMIGVALSYVLPFISLALFGESVDPNGDLSVALVGSVIGVVLTYALYNGALKMSRNKYGIAKDGIPYSLKEKYEEIFERGKCEDENDPATESYDPDSVDD